MSHRQPPLSPRGVTDASNGAELDCAFLYQVLDSLGLLGRLSDEVSCLEDAN